METANKTVKRFNQFQAARRKARRVPPRRDVPELDSNQAAGKQYIQGKFFKDCITYTTGEVQPYEDAIQHEIADQEEIEVQEENGADTEEKSKRKRLKLHVLNNCRGLYENSVLARRVKIVLSSSWSPEDNARVTEDIQALAKIGPNSEASFKIVQPMSQQKQNSTDQNPAAKDDAEKVVSETRQVPSDCRQILTSVIDLDALNEDNFVESEPKIQDPAQLINPGQQSDHGEKSPAAFLPGGISKSNEPKEGEITDHDSPLLARRRSKRNFIVDDDDEDMDIEMNTGTSKLNNRRSPAHQMDAEAALNTEANSNEEVELFKKRKTRSRIYHPRRAKDGINTRHGRTFWQQNTPERLNVNSFPADVPGAYQENGSQPEATNQFSDFEKRTLDVSASREIQGHPYFEIVGSGTQDNLGKVDPKNVQGVHSVDQEVELSQARLETHKFFEGSPSRVQEGSQQDREALKSFLDPVSRDRSLEEPCHQLARTSGYSRVKERDSIFLELPASSVQDDNFFWTSRGEGAPRDSSTYLAEAREEPRAADCELVPAPLSFTAGGNTRDCVANPVSPKSLRMYQQTNNEEENGLRPHERMDTSEEGRQSMAIQDPRRPRPPESAVLVMIPPKSVHHQRNNDLFDDSPYDQTQTAYLGYADNQLPVQKHQVAPRETSLKYLNDFREAPEKPRFADSQLFRSPDLFLPAGNARNPITNPSSPKSSIPPNPSHHQQSHQFFDTTLGIGTQEAFSGYSEANNPRNMRGVSPPMQKHQEAPRETNLEHLDDFGEARQNPRSADCQFFCSPKLSTHQQRSHQFFNRTSSNKTLRAFSGYSVADSVERRNGASAPMQEPRDVDLTMEAQYSRVRDGYSSRMPPKRYPPNFDASGWRTSENLGSRQFFHHVPLDGRIMLQGISRDHPTTSQEMLPVDRCQLFVASKAHLRGSHPLSGVAGNRVVQIVENLKTVDPSAENPFSKRQPTEGRNSSQFFNQDGRSGNPKDPFYGTSSTSQGLLGSPRIKSFADPDDKKLNFKPGRRSDPLETFRNINSDEFGGNILLVSEPETNATRMRSFSSSSQGSTVQNVYRLTDRPPSPCNY